MKYAHAILAVSRNVEGGGIQVPCAREFARRARRGKGAPNGRGPCTAQCSRQQGPGERNADVLFWLYAAWPWLEVSLPTSVPRGTLEKSFRGAIAVAWGVYETSSDAGPAQSTRQKSARKCSTPRGRAAPIARHRPLTQPLRRFRVRKRAPSRRG